MAVRRVALVVSLLGLVAAGLFAAGAAARSTPTTPQVVRLPAKVTIGGVRVGRMKVETALGAVQLSARRPLVVRVGTHKFTVSPERFGLIAYAKIAVARARHARPGTAVPLSIIVHGKPVRAYLASLARRFDRTPIDSVLLLRKLAPYVTKGRVGQKLDQLGGTAEIVHTLAANRRTPVAVQLIPVPQKVSRANFGPVVVIRRESRQLYLYKGMHFEREFAVAVGQSAYPTPLGRFSILVKWRNPWWYPPQSPWAQGLKPVPPGPGNPLGTRWMGLSAPGVGIHGTPDDASVGYSLSHGCIRMHIPDAEWLFEHVDIGTTVFIVPA
jgi:lipoprotein-anchoring transpeptidase ErfK/SrfK